MIRTLLAATVLLSVATAPAIGAPCRDAHGKFTKCPPTAAASTGTRCRDAKGHFAKCGTAGAVPVAKK